MSGAQGALPKEAKTATTYESVEEGENRTRTKLRSQQDQGGIQVDKIEDKVPDPVGKGGPVFGAGKDENKQDLGVTGTG
ncbi:seed maturation protein [Trema orientale]|uniref:Seed maturation protein n=1 Tax=Trema orientale TaxID=63057 RepID=A0A2P5APB3_TREOI|nr:seed maturation protein [Trema orientale]